MFPGHTVDMYLRNQTYTSFYLHTIQPYDLVLQSSSFCTSCKELFALSSRYLVFLSSLCSLITLSLALMYPSFRSKGQLDRA